MPRRRGEAAAAAARTQGLPQAVILIDDSGSDGEQAPDMQPSQARGSNDAPDLSPGFRTAAAMAGWDDQSLLMVAMDAGGCEHSTPNKDVGAGDRKREVRTPGHAITPASAQRMHRRLRRPPPAERSSAASLAALSLEEGSEDQGRPVEEDRVASEGTSEGTRVPSEGSMNKVEGTKKKPEAASGGTNKKGEAACEGTDKEAKPQPDGKENMKIQQLKDELSCAVCLEICFEPSTTSCGHSFCKACLQSVVRKCGPRCPKCRQSFKGDVAVNVVLWNTIQILFPEEAIKRSKNKQKHSPSERPTGSPSPTGSFRGEGGGPSVNRNRPIGFRRLTQPYRAPRREAVDIVEIDAPPSAREQEDMDAALASRLQEAEFMRVDSGGFNRFRRRLQTAEEGSESLAVFARRAARHYRAR